VFVAGLPNDWPQKLTPFGHWFVKLRSHKMVTPLSSELEARYFRIFEAFCAGPFRQYRFNVSADSPAGGSSSPLLHAKVRRQRRIIIGIARRSGRSPSPFRSELCVPWIHWLHRYFETWLCLADLSA